jgi:hypothetical protein
MTSARRARSHVHGKKKQLDDFHSSHPTSAPRLNTSFVERYHRTDRGMLAFKQRVSTHLAQKSWHYDCASWLSIASYNFCRGHAALGGRTPAQAAGAAAECWSLLEVLTKPVPPGTLLPPPALSERFRWLDARSILASQRYPEAVGSMACA